MCPSVWTSSKVKFGIFVWNWIFCVALVKSTVTVKQNCFCPISENIFGRIYWKYTLANFSLWPIDWTSVNRQTALITILYSFWYRFSSTSPTSLHIDQNIFGIALMKIQCRRWSIQTSSFWIMINDNLMIDFFLSIDNR